MQKTKYLYCDSCVFLAYFNGETSRIDILDQLFEEVQKDKDKKLITSAFSIIEVAYIAEERKKSKLQEGLEEKIDTFWGDTSLIQFVDFHENIARQARTMMRHALEKGYSLKSADALHLVSAHLVGSEEFLTYDDKLFRYEEMLGFKILEPYVNQKRLI